MIAACIWVSDTVNAMNSYGQATSYTLGNGQTSTLSTNYGMPTEYKTPGIQDLQLSYDWPSGDLRRLRRTSRNSTSNAFIAARYRFK